VTNRPVNIKIKKKFPPGMRSHKTPFRKRIPYWNFWRVILAGWIIKYPKIVWIPIVFSVILIYNAIVK